MSRPSSFVVILAGVALAGRASAQTFPADGAFVPFTCGNAPMVDGVGDTPGATGALDLVGTNPFPAGFHAADAQFLYLRLRLAASPLVGNNTLGNDGWGFEIDLDGDRTTYELLISASGTGNTSQVAIYRHPTAATPNDPADPSVTPPAFTYAFATHGRAVAANSTLSGATDEFLDSRCPGATWPPSASRATRRCTCGPARRRWRTRSISISPASAAPAGGSATSTSAPPRPIPTPAAAAAAAPAVAAGRAAPAAPAAARSKAGSAAAPRRRVAPRRRSPFSRCSPRRWSARRRYFRSSR